MRLRLGAFVLGVLACVQSAAGAVPPSVVFILLDTTRADRLSAWGNPRRTTPVLDALAADGVMFRRHFANSHATRPSLPQLMTGRYYHQNILRVFMPDRHPREFPFSRPDPTAVLLPEVFRQHGYQTLGVSAHWWVVAESPLGQAFDRLELVPVEASRGHADAAEVVDRALALWHERDRTRPLFLYLHFMDMHMPRFLPGGDLRFPVEGYDWRQRFRPSGEPLFDRERRRWERADARDFTDQDRQYFAAVYDTRLAYTDEQLGRLLGAVRADDPGLRDTLVVVVADHGEELGEDGRTDHTDSLVDGIQHIPWIVAGGVVAPGQRADRFTENIDVAPTVLALAGLPLPPGVRMDGRAQLKPDGRVCAACGKAAVYYAWEDYRAIRTNHHLLREESPGSGRARCLGRESLYRLRGGRRVALDPRGHTGDEATLHRRLVRRLGARERAFRATRYGPPRTSFVLRPDFWAFGDAARLGCVEVGVDTDRRQLDQPGWIWSGRGVALLGSDGSGPLPVALPAPDGEYRVEAGVVPTARMPWLFGFARWLRKSFLPDFPAAYVPLGTVRATAGRIALSVPPDAVGRSQVVGLRLTPPGAPTEASPPPMDEEQRRRLRALGYVD